MTYANPNRDYACLHPAVRPMAVAFFTHPEIKALDLHLFEGWRHPLRQLKLYNQRPQVTKAGPWRSAHQYGLAFDAVRKYKGNWNWDINQSDIRAAQLVGHRIGMRTPIDWDPLHFQHPAWDAVYDTLF